MSTPLKTSNTKQAFKKHLKKQNLSFSHTIADVCPPPKKRGAIAPLFRRFSYITVPP